MIEGEIVKPTPFDWRRGPRSRFSLTNEKGVYALFLRKGAVLPDCVKSAEGGLIYIGLAANRHGLKGRCHFDAKTRNHSPRKSLAVLLMAELALVPILIQKPKGRFTWGLEPASDARLSAWMHANLELAIEVCDEPDRRESELIARSAPPLNLRKCAQTIRHRKIATARAGVLRRLRGDVRLIDNGFAVNSANLSASCSPEDRRSHGRKAHEVLRSTIPYGCAELDTAESIAARYGLLAKSYRQRLRCEVSWYRKPQDWTFPVNSREWQDMITVAEMMASQGR